jgi:chromate transporter
MRDNAALSGAMAAITAAVVGVILNLAVWFGLHVLFREVTTLTLGPLSWDLPVLSSVNWPSLILTLLAAVALFALRQSVITVLLVSALLGIAWQVVSRAG